MKLVLKVVVVFIVVALLLLLVFAYLEKREDNSATAILDDLCIQHMTYSYQTEDCHLPADSPESHFA